MALIALQGKPGSGKSTMCATMTSLGYHVHYVDMDKKVKSLENLQPLLQEGKISYIECPYKLQDKKLKMFANMGIKEAYPTIKPEGYLWLCDYIDWLGTFDPEDEIDLEGIGTFKCSELVITIDSFTAVNRHLKNFMRHHSKGPKLGFDGWDSLLQNYQFFFDALRDLTPSVFPHIIVTVHVRDDVVKDGDSSRTESRPLLDGQFRDELATFCEEFYFLKIEAAGPASTPKYVSYTVPVNEIQHARSSIVHTVKVESDFKTIFGRKEEPWKTKS